MRRSLALWSRASARYVAVLLVVALGSAFAYFSQFSYFSFYDDEGFMMKVVEFVLLGARPYADLHSVYGPAFYVYRWLPFGWVQVPMTHDAGRSITVIVWIATAVLAGLAARRMAGEGQLVYAGAFSLTCLHLEALRKEPGHPQELIVLCIALSLFLVARWPGTELHPWGMLGAATATIALTKLNVGAFFGAAALIAIADAVPNPWARVLRSGVGMGIVIFVHLLLGPSLPALWAVALAASVLGGYGLFLAICSVDRPTVSPSGALLTFGAGLLIATGALLFALVALFQDSPWAMLGGILVASGRFLEEFRLLPPAGWGTMTSVFGSLSLGALGVWCVGRQQHGIISLLRICAIGTLLLGIATRAAWLPFLTPTLAWLVLVPCDTVRDSLSRPARTLAAALAVTLPLQIVPVAGTQLQIGSLPASMLTVMLAAQSQSDLRPARRSLLALVTTCAVLILSAGTVQAVQQYVRNEPVRFPGFQLTRLHPIQASTYRWLVGSVRSGSTFVSDQGSYSLSYWTGHRATGEAEHLLQGWTMRHVPPGAQSRIRDAIAADPDCTVIRYRYGLDPRSWEHTPVGDYVSATMSIESRFFDYSVLRRTPFREPPAGRATVLQRAARHTEATDVMEPTMGAHGLPTDPLPEDAGRIVLDDLGGRPSIAQWVGRGWGGGPEVHLRWRTISYGCERCLLRFYRPKGGTYSLAVPVLEAVRSTRP